jgi:hypothetical protein
MDPWLSTSGLHQDFYKSQWFNQWNTICGECDIQSSSLRNFFPLSFKLHSYTPLSYVQTFTSATRCWTCPMHDDPVGQHCCTFAVGTRLPLPLRVKLHAPLISETILSQNTCHRVWQVHDNKIWIIWNKLYSFHTHEHFQFCKSCQDVLLPSVLCLTTYECVSRTLHM